MNNTQLKEQMISRQLTARGITDLKVIAAFRRVNRADFVPEKQRPRAYKDRPLSIGEGQTISQPYMAALMTQCLGLTGSETVLEIGTGSGYQTAILAELAGHVYSVERIAKLFTIAQERLSKTGYHNVRLKVSDGTEGWAEHAPYDAIIVTAGAPKPIAALIEQLKLSGRLIMPLGNKISQTLTILTKRKNKLDVEEVCGCAFVPLLGKYGWKE